MVNEENWGFKTPSLSSTPSKKSYLCDKLLVSYYCVRDNVLTISWIVVNKPARRKVISEGEMSERQRYKSE